MAELLKRYAQVTGASDGSDSVTVAAIFSNDDIARDGHVFLTSGMDTAAFERNPVVPYAHNTDEPPVGTVTSLSKGASELKGTVRFTPAEIYPFGAMIGKMYQAGYLRAFSVGIRPLQASYATGANRAPGAMDVTRSEILEISAVPVPALTSALTTARAFGMSDVSAAARWAERRLDLRGAGKSAVAELCALRKAAISPPIFHLLGRTK